MSGPLHDLRFGVRMLAKNRGFTAVAVATLALGIGANTAIFSVVRASLLTPVAISDPERVVVVWTENPGRQWHHIPASIPDFRDWKNSGVFEALTGFTDGGFNLRRGEGVERVTAEFVTPEMFDVLGVKPALGRVFTEEDMRTPAVVLTDSLWRSAFAADAGVIGRKIVLDGEPHVVIGVLPADLARLETEQMYAPLDLDTSKSAHDRGSRFFGVAGRLKRGVSFEAAQARMADLSRRLAQQYPDDDAGNAAVLQPMEEAFVEDIEPLVLIVFAAVGFVLLIACANIANLLLARGTDRHREMAIRAALGARRWTLARQLLAESGLLGLMGGIAAVIPALWGVDLITSFKLQDLPNASLIRLDAGVLVFNFALAIGTGLLFGLAPAWQVWRTDVGETLKAGGRGSAGRIHQRLRGAFVVSEVAVTLVLLAGAGMMVESFVRMRVRYPGYNEQGVLTMELQLSERRYDSAGKQTAYVADLVRRLAAIPGASHASAGTMLPGGDSIHGSGLWLPDRPEPKRADVPIVLVNEITPDYLRTLETPLVEGRAFTDADRDGAPLVAIVDAWTAKRYWPGASPVGKSLKLGRSLPERRIVGVVGNVEKGAAVQMVKGDVGEVYVPFAQSPRSSVSLAVRAAGNPAALTTAVEKAARELDRDQPVFDVRTLQAFHRQAQAPQRLSAQLLGGFAALGLLLAAIGIYGVVAYSAGRRTREIGIRMALGAGRREVLRLLLGQGMTLTLLGMAAGLAGSLALSKLLAAALPGVVSAGPLPFACASVALAAAAGLASYIPARRATKIDPVHALRIE
ncbi:MAG TPA: ABC transporter permease [Bryobacteraceae bacterium]